MVWRIRQSGGSLSLKGMTGIHLEIPNRCTQCKQLKDCVWVNEYLHGNGPASEFVVRWKLMKKCTRFEWENKLTSYDFKEIA